MKTFLGVGLGPIQTSIFLDGSFRDGFDRLVITDVGKIRSGQESLWESWYDELEAVWCCLQEMV